MRLSNTGISLILYILYFLVCHSNEQYIIFFAMVKSDIFLFFGLYMFFLRSEAYTNTFLKKIKNCLIIT